MVELSCFELRQNEGRGGGGGGGDEWNRTGVDCEGFGDGILMKDVGGYRCTAS